jgi:hypothetical protein
MALSKLNVDFDPMVIGADTRVCCLEKRVKGGRSGKKAPERPWKASAMNGNQQARFTEPKE